MEDEREIIQHYFNLGYENEVIRQFLADYHGIRMSLSTLKRRLRDYGLKRRENDVNVDQLRDVIRNEIRGSGESQGYRAVWHSLRLVHQIHVPRHLVATILQEVDPVGVQQRRRRRLSRRRYVSYGPNFCWHVDGYDKLKPYGFPIHGAIDGYSRKILWLELTRSNNKPENVAEFYLEFVKGNGGCPLLLRTDCGTENGLMAGMQCYFRQDGEDTFAGEKAHKYGSSPANQRIEAWWSKFRQGRAGWWIDFLKDMVSAGLLDIGNAMQMACLWFCFEAVLQNELDKVKEHWNTHCIRSSGHGTVPGVPDVLFYLPERSSAVDCKWVVQSPKLDEMEQHLNVENNDDEADIYQEYFQYVMNHQGLQLPSSIQEAFDLFQQLKALCKI